MAVAKVMKKDSEKNMSLKKLCVPPSQSLHLTSRVVRRASLAPSASKRPVVAFAVRRLLSLLAVVAALAQAQTEFVG